MLAADAWGHGDAMTVLAVLQLDRTSFRFLASWVSPGSLLNQFSLDIYNGTLRVATTSTGAAANAIRAYGVPTTAQLADAGCDSWLAGADYANCAVRATPGAFRLLGALTGLAPA